MSGDGDARGLEAAAAAAAEAARELREAAAALVATRAAEEDALRRRAVALDADVRRLQGSLHGLDPSTLDKVEEELERARVAITDSDVASFLPSKRNGKFLRKFLGPVNVRVARKEDRLKIKDEYNNYRDRTAYKFLLFPSILLLLRWWIWDGCLPALAVQIYQAWLLYLYTSFALRENVLIANGSDIRPWWIYHHYLAMLMALISLTWEIKGQPDCSSKQRGVQLFLRWAIMQGIAMHLQNRYQRQRLRTRIALGKDVDEYYDWEKYRLIFSCYETDEAYVKYWDQLTKKMKWVDDALLLGHKEFSMRYDDRGGRQAVKIAAGLCHLPASLATRGYEEYVLARQYDLDCRKGYDLVYFEVWKRISKQEMSFKEALKDILSSENKLSSSCLFRIQAEIKGCGLMRRNYSICMDDIQKLVVKGGEGAVSKKHFTDAVYSKIPIPKLYVDYAKKKLEVARRIHLMPGMGLARRIENGQSDSENGTVY